ncbi:hypothetical protein [Enterobacter phage 04_vB_Eclo_IJM]|nr:hypothetical protein [Enterobacter phage 04_vB_Eclo_IJM]
MTAKVLLNLAGRNLGKVQRTASAYHHNSG